MPSKDQELCYKDQELCYIDALRRSFGQFPSGDLLPCETPDILIQSPHGIVGVEVTVIHLPPSLGERPHQEQQAIKDRIVKRAWANHVESGGRPLYVSVHFTSSPLDKGSVRRVADQIVAAIARTSVPDQPEIEVVVPWHDLPSETSSISIRSSIDGKDQLWHADAGGWVAAVSTSDVQSVIDGKARMVSRARERCDELWLLIVNDQFSRAAQAELSPEATNAEYTHCFDRVLWLVPHIPVAVELHSRRAA